MKICKNCAKPGFVQTDAYGGKKIFCSYCANTTYTEINAKDWNNNKYVDCYCLECGKINSNVNHLTTTCKYCYGSLFIKN